MSESKHVVVPDIGDFDSVEVVEVLVSPGARVEVDDSLITLESDKASMEVPSTLAGRVVEVVVGIGDQVAAGDVIVRIEPRAESETAPPASSVGPSRHPHDADSGGVAAPTEPAESSEVARAEAESSAAGSSDVDADVVVLGGGPGGYTAAFRAADLGQKVVLVEQEPKLGGVCLNVGCIPSKALLHVARVIDETQSLADHGVTFGSPQIDLGQLIGWKDGVVNRLVGGLSQLAKRRGVEVVHGVGRLEGPRRLRVTPSDPDGEERVLRFNSAILAVGSRPAELPGFPHEDPRVWDSTDALAPESIPATLLVVGGGIIGLEMATVYAALGTRVTVVELLDELISGCDRDLVRPLARRLEASCEAIHLGIRVEQVVAEDDGLRVRFASAKGSDSSDSSDSAPPGEALYDAVLVAVGRRPNGDRIGAEAAGLPVDERGFLTVDDQQRTSVEGLYAVGDVVGQPMLAHKATHEAKVAAEVASGLKSGFDARVIPSVAYTDPEIAWVGLTETEAAAQGVEVEKGVFPWAASGRALSVGRDEGLTKLLFDPRTHRIVGAGIVGPNAGDLISEAALAIEMGSDAADLALTIHPHPTLSESIGMAAEAYEGTITDLYLPAKKRKTPGPRG